MRTASIYLIISLFTIESYSQQFRLILWLDKVDSVYVDGKRKNLSKDNQTRIIVDSISEGVHSIRLIKDGYHSKKDIIYIVHNKNNSRKHGIETINYESKSLIPKDNSKFGLLTDERDGSVYGTVMIGDKTWMSENLNYFSGSGCWNYQEDFNNGNIYGKLYDWHTAIRVCPSGWHLPSSEEWESTKNSLLGWAGEKMKSERFGGNNESGLSVLGAGFRAKKFLLNKHLYYRKGEHAYFWTSTTNQKGKLFAVAVVLLYDFRDIITEEHESKETGYSVRCVKDNKE